MQRRHDKLDLHARESAARCLSTINRASTSTSSAVAGEIAAALDQLEAACVSDQQRYLLLGQVRADFLYRRSSLKNEPYGKFICALIDNRQRNLPCHGP